MNPGAVVRFRNRDWVVMPSEHDEIIFVRPLTGTEDDVVKIHRHLASRVSKDLTFERLEPAAFPLPTAENISDAASAHLLWQAARLTLREGATPFRSLGRISIRPRVYQFVPLLMALRLDLVRLFIADDVGVGKTIEALLIARELFDRREIRRFCVLCPPYLCEQWASELAQKFNLEPVVIRSGTLGQLERQVPLGKSVYEHFPVQIASIDFVKTDRNRHQFLQFCPEFVIVDEAHGATGTQGRSQQERHALLRELAQDTQRHLILLTATPHSGIEEAFRSLLSLLRPEFGQWNIAELAEDQRITLAHHFVQRTRADILHHWESAAPFPKRVSEDATYDLSDRYRQLFERAYEFCSEMVQAGEQLEARRKRVRYWGALALLRCVMSSPAAAVAALTNRAGLSLEEDEPDLAFRPFVFESTEERTEDESPAPPMEATEATLQEADRRQLRNLAKAAKALHGPNHDTKLRRAIEVVQGLLKAGFQPILWCRYVATAEYVAEHLRQTLSQDVQVVCITGRMGDEERQAKIEKIKPDQPRVLVATDCLSEGINLQEKFTAVVHYDLPWNPNRLEQREGRIDRYGQPAETVKAVRFFGRDNPIDGVVIRVLLDKANEIHRALGTYVPVPEESESVMQAVLQALFLRKQAQHPEQLELSLDMPNVTQLHHKWERDAERERISRTRFAQRTLKPEEVQRELEATDAVLGDPAAVRDFVLSAAQRIRLPIAKDPNHINVWRVSLNELNLATVPEAVRQALPRQENWRISFESPTPEGAEYLGRNHRFVAALARYLLEEALAEHSNPVASRCGALRTQMVSALTTLLLLRVRYLIEQPHARQLLSEEVLAVGYTGNVEWLSDSEALRLLAEAKPDANISANEKRELVQRELNRLGEWQVSNGEWGQGNKLQKEIGERIKERAQQLKEAHKRIRQAVELRVRGLEVKPQFPPDLLGLLVLQPVVQNL